MVVSDVGVGLELEPERAVVRLAGQLTLRASAEVRSLLVKLLASRGEVLVDLSSLRLTWRPAVSVFPSALSTAGGWPAARIVLFGADPVMAAELVALRVTQTVPLTGDLETARRKSLLRPKTVVRRLRLLPSVAAPRSGREFTAGACQDWQIDATAEVACLVANELVTNVVVHSGTECVLTLRLTDQGLFIEARDYLPGPAPRPRPRLVGGPRRGLHVVARLASHWDASNHTDGKTVWALVPVTAPTTEV